MSVDTPTKLSVFLTLILRFCGGLADGDVEYSMVVSNTHHTFYEKFDVFIIFSTCWGSFGEPFRIFVLLLGTLLEVVFFGSSEGNQDGWVIMSKGVGGPQENHSSRQPQGKDRPRDLQGPEGPIPRPGAKKDHKDINKNWHASPLKARRRI